jgi:hypothetical protein
MLGKRPEREAKDFHQTSQSREWTYLHSPYTLAGWRGEIYSKVDSAG